MRQNNSSLLQEFLEPMTTQQLETLLNDELHRDNVDPKSVQLILHILRERDNKAKLVITPQIEEAWDEYQREIASFDSAEKKQFRFSSFGLRAVAVVALVFALLFSIVPQEVQAKTLWEKLTRFTESIFEFFSPADNMGRVADYVFTTDIPSLQQVYDTVVEMGITQPVVPMWLPDGFEAAEIKKIDGAAYSTLYSCFVNQASHIAISFDIYYDEVSHKYIKDESIIETLEIEGVVHTIIQNEDRWTAIWTVDNIECSIFVDCQEDVLYRILRSIYTMEDT